jgi:RNA polymerase sigma factor (sigma-70 family)
VLVQGATNGASRLTPRRLVVPEGGDDLAVVRRRAEPKEVLAAVEQNPSDSATVTGPASPAGGEVPAGTPVLDLSTAEHQSEIDPKFAGWLESRLQPMWNYALFRCRDRHLADDLVQSAAEKLLRMWPDENARRRITDGEFAYLAKVIDSAYADFGRACARSDRRVGRLTEAALAALRAMLGSRDLETVWTVREAVQSLEAQQRTLIYLVYYDGDNVSEAGRRVGLTAAKAHRVHEKAKERLRSLLQPLMDAEGEEWRSNGDFSKTLNPSHRSSKGSTAQRC